MRSFFSLLFSTFIIAGATLTVQAQKSGEELFKSDCTACHTIGKGTLVGPDLVNIGDRHPQEWLIRFIKSSQTVIKSGDKYADSLFQAYHQVPMPDHPNLSDDDIKGILAYIGIKSERSDSDAGAASTELPEGNSDRGKALFVGNIRFANNGAACNSCHNVDIEGYISGGALGKDLTHSVGRLTANGVANIISVLPFPQMKETYSSHPVTPQEIADITAFLTNVNKQAPETIQGNTGNYLLIGGLIGISVLLGLYSFFWIRRKKGPVNTGIFDRQIKSA